MNAPAERPEVRAFELGQRGAIAILLSANLGGEPPTEFRVFEPGVTRTTKGQMLFDDLAAKMVLEAFRDQGMDQLPFDVGHGMLNPLAPPDGHKAAGWFTPEVRNGALWASNIEWTATAANSLRNREFRYFSPAFFRDVQTGRVVELINIALTNIPATKGQRPLVASQNPEASMEDILRRIPHSLHDWARTQTREQLAVFLQNAPAVSVPSAPSISAPTNHAHLSKIERKVIAQLGVTESDYLATRAQLHEIEAERLELSRDDHSSGKRVALSSGATVWLSRTEFTVAEQLGITPQVFAAEKVRLEGEERERHAELAE